MRAPPELTVEFFDTRLTAEIKGVPTTYDIKFRVKGPGGYKKDWIPIKGFTLNADF